MIVHPDTTWFAGYPTIYRIRELTPDLDCNADSYLIGNMEFMSGVVYLVI